MTVDRLLAGAFVERHPAAAARVMERLGPEAWGTVGGMEEIPTHALARALSRSAPAFTATALSALPHGRAAAVLDRFDVAVAARVLRASPEAGRPALLAGLEEGARSALEALLRFPEGTAGSVMDPRFLAVPSDVTVGEAVLRFEKEAHRLLSYVYVVGRDGALEGVASVRALMTAEAGQPVGDCARPVQARLDAGADVQEILAHPGWEDHHTLPVVDGDGVLLGVVPYAAYRRLERESRGQGRAQGLVDTGVALAELYWVVLARALAGAKPAPAPDPSRPGETP